MSEDPKAGKNEKWWSIFWTIAAILFLRGFVAEPFRIPSPSMLPTLLIGDHLFVSKSSYDIRIPFTTTSVVRVSDPERGDVVVFDYPNHENEAGKSNIYYIKRVIAIPGDRVRIVDGYPEINGTAAKVRRVSGSEAEIPGFGPSTQNALFRELLPGAKSEHWVHRHQPILNALPDLKEQLRSEGVNCFDIGFELRGFRYGGQLPMNEVCEFVVPENQYFVMGDNRDDSLDGRAWGFVDRKLLKGKALFIWLSLKFKDRMVNPQSVDLGDNSAFLDFIRLNRFALRI